MNLTRWKSPPQLAPDTRDFTYGPLKSAKTGIRLAQILPGSGNKGLAIQLKDSYVSGTGQLPYDALSYTWGAGSRTKFISCNGKRLYVTPTLVEALQRFRDRDHIVTLWIDQLCICQERVKERNQQVQMMGDIFKQARKVSVWLGDDYDDSRAGMQLAKQLLGIARHQQMSGLEPSEFEAHGLPRHGSKRWKALAAVLKRPWFWRTWVVQEVVLNPHVELVLGEAVLTWDELESIVALIEGPIPKIWQMDAVISSSELPFSRINRIRLRHRRRITTPVTPTQGDVDFHVDFVAEPEAIANDSEDEDDPELLDLLLMSRGLGATDPRDKIYALLGLGKHDINPDYDMSPESVFTDFALQTVGIATNMLSRREAAGLSLSSHDEEVRRAFVLLACAGRQNQKLDLPFVLPQYRNITDWLLADNTCNRSWVPDWSVNLSSRPLIFGIGQKYSAGGDLLGLFDWHHDSGLQLSGLLLDTVRLAGTVLLDDSNDQGFNAEDLVAQWWLEAQDIALRRLARSPGSTMYTDAFEAMRRRLCMCRHGHYIGDSRQKRRGSLLDDADLNAHPCHSASMTLTLGPTRGRVFFATSIGFLGLAPHGTRPGDVVFVIRGADVPYVLRPCDDGYELIGEAYVEGVMAGEALEMGQFLPQDVMIR